MSGHRPVPAGKNSQFVFSIGWASREFLAPNYPPGLLPCPRVSHSSLSVLTTSHSQNGVWQGEGNYDGLFPTNSAISSDKLLKETPRVLSQLPIVSKTVNIMIVKDFILMNEGTSLSHFLHRRADFNEPCLSPPHNIHDCSPISGWFRVPQWRRKDSDDGVRLMGKMKKRAQGSISVCAFSWLPPRSPSLLLRRRFLFSKRPLNSLAGRRDLAHRQPTNLPKREKEGISMVENKPE